MKASSVTKRYRIRPPDGSDRVYGSDPVALEKKYFEGFNPVYRLSVLGWVEWTGKSKKSAYWKAGRL